MPTTTPELDPAATLDLILERCIHKYHDDAHRGPRWWVDFPGARFGPHETREAAIDVILESAKRGRKA